MVDPFKIIEKYYDKHSRLYHILTAHGALVMCKAFAIADRLPYEKIDRLFLKESAMLHDIGIFLTHAPDIDCHGNKPYIKHGYLGGQLLRKEGFPRHARVCERHTGVGISKQEIIKNKLPLPKRDFLPLTIEEQIICFADKFYSKRPEMQGKEETIVDIRKEMSKFGKEKVDKFNIWLKKFGV